MGVACVHGIALGSPVVPEEKRMLVKASGLAGRAVNDDILTRNLFHSRSVPRSFTASDDPLLGHTMHARAPASTTLAYMGSVLPPRTSTSCVTATSARAIRSRVRISSGAKESAMETTTAPALTMPRYAATASTVMGMAMATPSPERTLRLKRELAKR